MEDYRQYLAQKILTEDQVVTYRLLSRALKVHVNTAKEMLYDFHKWQNDKRPGSLHATYIIYGTKTKPKVDDEDVEMTDSQMSDDRHAPFSDLVPTHTLSLVSEEQLHESLTEYSEVTSIHIYSLASHPLEDFQLLADTARQVLELSQADTTLSSSKVYGTIANPNVRRRERRGGSTSVASTPASKLESKPPTKQEPKPEAPSTVKEDSKRGSQSSSKSAATSAPAKKAAPATLKRQGSSGISQMFAKQAAKPKKPAAKASESPATSAAASSAEVMSDDGEDDGEPIADVQQEDSGVRQARRNRHADLRRMMEESDEEEPDKAESPAEEDPMEEEQPPSEPEPEPTAEEPAEVISSTSEGRRRGRRRVMRKQQIMDDKGYLVTIQEQGWESFSEDEAPPPPPKAQQQPVKSEPAAKSKKVASKAAQGNIMSFFSKK